MRARTQGLKRARAIAAENGIVLYEGVLVAKYPDGYVAHLKWNGSKWEEFTP